MPKAAGPSQGFETRILLTDILPNSPQPIHDVCQCLDLEDPVTLAILGALRNLQRFDLVDEAQRWSYGLAYRWHTNIDQERLHGEVTMKIGGQEKIWDVWVHEYLPSEPALAALVGSRVEGSLADLSGLHTMRKLVGLVPRENSCAEGRVFNTLPTKIALKTLRMHLNGDWLPDSTRQRLQGFEHPWQVINLCL